MTTAPRQRYRQLGKLAFRPVLMFAGEVAMDPFGSVG